MTREAVVALRGRGAADAWSPIAGRGVTVTAACGACVRACGDRASLRAGTLTAVHDHHPELVRDAWNANLVALVADCHALWTTVDDLSTQPSATLQRADAHAARARARLDAVREHIDDAVRLASHQSGLAPRT